MNFVVLRLLSLGGFMQNDDDFKELLMKKANVYDVEEVVEEYSDVNGELVLTKKKVTHKHIPPDSTLLKILLESKESTEDDLENCSEEELKEMLKNIIEEGDLE